MTDFSLFNVDLDTERPNPNDPTKVIRGDSPRTAFTKHNDLLVALHGSVRYVDDTEPLNPIPGMQWASTVTEPPTEYVRNAANTGWILVSSPVDTRPNKQTAYLLLNLPDPALWQHYTIVVTNATGGAKLCMSDGTNWNLVNTNTPVT